MTSEVKERGKTILRIEFKMTAVRKEKKTKI